MPSIHIKYISIKIKSHNWQNVRWLVILCLTMSHDIVQRHLCFCISTHWKCYSSAHYNILKQSVSWSKSGLVREIINASMKPNYSFNWIKSITFSFISSHHLNNWCKKKKYMYVVTFLNFRMEAYSAAVGSWMARELTEDRGDLLTPLAPLPLPVTGPLMVPFPLPFPLPPWE